MIGRKKTHIFMTNKREIITSIVVGTYKIQKVKKNKNLIMP